MCARYSYLKLKFFFQKKIFRVTNRGKPQFLVHFYVFCPYLKIGSNAFDEILSLNSPYGYLTPLKNKHVLEKSGSGCTIVARPPFSRLMARGGVRGSKKQVWPISKSNLSWSYHFLQNFKLFVYDENIARQSSRVLI